MQMLRRSFLQGLGAALFVAPAIVRAENLMPIREYMPDVPPWCPPGWLPFDGREIKAKYYPELHAMLKKQRLPLHLRDDDDRVTQFRDDRVTQWYSGYDQIPNQAPLGARNIISYKKLLRPNGKIMEAGAGHIMWVPEGT